MTAFPGRCLGVCLAAGLLCATLALSACDTASDEEVSNGALPAIEAFSFKPDSVFVSERVGEAVRVPLSVQATVSTPGGGAVDSVRLVVYDVADREALLQTAMDEAAPGQYVVEASLALPDSNALYRVLVFATSRDQFGGEARGLLRVVVDSSQADSTRSSQPAH